MTLFCCCSPFSIIGAVFASQAKSLANDGATVQAESKLKTAKTLTIVGIVLGLLGWIGGVVAQIMGGLAQAL